MTALLGHQESKETFQDQFSTFTTSEWSLQASPVRAKTLRTHRCQTGQSGQAWGLRVPSKNQRHS